MFREDVRSIDDAVFFCNLLNSEFSLRETKQQFVFSEGTEVRSYYKPPSHNISPQWSDFATEYFDLEVEETQSRSPSFLIFVKTAGRVFCVSFGQAHHKLDTAILEPNFGQQITLNVSVPRELRRVKRRGPGRRGVKTTDTHRSYSAAVLDLASDMSTDVLRDVEGKVMVRESLVKIGGQDALSWLAPSDIEELVETCECLLGWYKNTENRPREFSVLSKVIEERSGDITNALESRFFDHILSENAADFSVLPVTFKDDLLGVHYRCHSLNGPYEADELTPAMIKVLAEQVANYQELKTIRVEVFDSEGKRIADRGLGQFLSRVDYNDPEWIFCLDEGLWYRLTSDFAARLDSIVSETWIARENLLPSFTRGLREDAYNQGVSQIQGFEGYIVFDKDLIRLGSDGSGIEVCDLLTPDMEFICVKKGTKFNEISYVCAQALNSAQSFKESIKFRNRIKEQVANSPMIDLAHATSNCTFVIAIVARDSRKIPSDMSFNCKLKLAQTVESITTGLGYNAKIFHIPYV